MPEDEGTHRRERFRRICDAQNAIFRDIVLYSQPQSGRTGADLNLDRLLQERNGPILAAASEFRGWLVRNPTAHIPDPNAVDVADLTCEDP